jgi:hypothetical protein
MKPRFVIDAASSLAPLAAVVALSWFAGCRPDVEAHFSTEPALTPSKSEAPKNAGAPRPAADKPLNESQLELLDLAFKTASALPTEPHVKNRCRAQEAVVATCFDLDQPQRALGYIEKIDNWRRAASYADYAFYCAQHGNTAEVQHYMDLAQKLSPIVEDDSTQDWQRDRIKATIAKTHLLLGHTEQAARFENAIVDSERGMLDEVRAKILTPEAFDQQIKTVDSVVATNNFDQVRNSLAQCAQFFDRFYEDNVRRSVAEEKIKSSWGKLPIGVRIELLNRLSATAIAHKDASKALELVNETQTLADTAKWTTDDRIPFVARLAVLRFRAGDTEKARADLSAASALFEAEHDKIVNIYRAGVLRPVAEAYQSIGDTKAAALAYKRVVEECVANPNSRPRAEALSTTCCSMASSGFEPDAELSSRIHQIQNGLSAPW